MVMITLPSIYCAAIMMAKAKMPTQNNSDSILYTIKTLLEPEPRCQHPLKVDRQPWVARATSIGAKVWKDTSTRTRDNCKPCSMRRGDSRKRTKCCAFRCLHQTLLGAYNLEVSKRTPGKTMR
ncbi:hypothetical protein CK203_031291 [Vitis vinifera]|uniref:Uncharacterized protein n=1 Tax=Vitis vinifera TaxID=29760 RepID=A0A438IX94_VITVI|nr:hypothetical protein CK203_031291 [Vitis vinifera]